VITRGPSAVKEIDALLPKEEPASTSPMPKPVTPKSEFDTLMQNAQALYRAGRYPEAATAFKKALDLKPDNAKANHGIDQPNHQLRPEDTHSRQRQKYETHSQPEKKCQHYSCTPMELALYLTCFFRLRHTHNERAESSTKRKDKTLPDNDTIEKVAFSVPTDKAMQRIEHLRRHQLSECRAKDFR